VPVNSYSNQVVPCQLVPKPTRTLTHTLTNSYLLPTRTQTISYPIPKLVPKLTVLSCNVSYEQEHNTLFPSLPSPPSPLPLHSYVPFSYEEGPLNPARGSGERCKLPSGVWGHSPSRNQILVHFSLKIWHLVATVLTILLRINWPNFIPSPAD